MKTAQKNMPTNKIAYNKTSRIFHWVMALGLLGLIALGFYMEGLERSPAVFKLYGLHKAFGILMLAAFALRLAWRITSQQPAPVPMALWQEKAAALAHGVLYGLMGIMPLSGWAMSSAHGYPVSLFGWVTLPALSAKNEALADLFSQIHALSAWALVVFITIHVLGVLHHQFVLKDGLIRRMWK